MSEFITSRSLESVLHADSIGVRLNTDTVKRLNSFFEDHQGVLLVVRPHDVDVFAPVNAQLNVKLCKIGEKGTFYLIDDKDYIAKNLVDVYTYIDCVKNDTLYFSMSIDVSDGAMEDQAVLVFDGCKNIIACRISGEELGTVVAMSENWDNNGYKSNNDECEFKREFMENHVLTLLRYIGIDLSEIIIYDAVK